MLKEYNNLILDLENYILLFLVLGLFLDKGFGFLIFFEFFYCNFFVFNGLK